MPDPLEHIGSDEQIDISEAKELIPALSPMQSASAIRSSSAVPYIYARLACLIRSANRPEDSSILS